MRRFKKQPQFSRTHALAHTPIKNAEVEETLLDSGDLLLAYPVRARAWAAAWMRRLTGVSPGPVKKKLQLDALGTAVWRLLDGNRSVRQVVEAFCRQHRLEPKEAEIAVAQFLRELGRRGLIGMK